MDLKDLYQDIIVDHNRSPRNFRRIDHATRMAQGYNPLCGDKLVVYLTLKDGVIDDVSFQGEGCAISTASASLMTEVLRGKTEKEAVALFDNMHHLLTEDNHGVDIDELGKLAALEGVRAYPTRVKCATLCWHTLQAALEEADEPVTTE